MATITYQVLEEASKAGGPAALSEVTELALAGGSQALVAPAKYLDGNRPTYVFERRFVEGEPLNAVLIDSRTSEANRCEEALMAAVREGHPIISKMPRIIVSYDVPDGAGSTRLLEESDLQLPHRAFDAHIRLGFDPEHAGAPFIQNPSYVAARNASPANAWDLFLVSPATVLFGGWDSTRRQRQARFASCVNGEIIGILADQEAEPSSLATKRSGARIDPVAAGIYFSQKEADTLADRIGVEHAKAKGGKVSGSSFVLGAIPPSTDALDGISVRRLIRSRVLSFSSLRSLVFGRGAGGDQAIRALLAAVALSAMARADADLYLRANAHLVEAAEPTTTLFRRFGVTETLGHLDVDATDALLDQAYRSAHELAGVDWSGQVLRVKGDPAVVAAINDAAGE